MADVTEQVKALLDASELMDIGFFELFAARGAMGEDGSRDIVGTGRIEDVEIEDGVHDLGVYWTDDGDRILVRFLASLETEVGEVRVGAQAEYLLNGMRRRDVPVEVEESFVNRVAIMALVPYVRSALADLSGRVFGTTVTLGIVMPGDIAFARKGSVEFG